MKKQARKNQRFFQTYGLQVVSEDGVTFKYVTPKFLASCWGMSVYELKAWRDLSVGPGFYVLDGQVRYPVQAIFSWIMADPNKRSRYYVFNSQGVRFR